MRLPQMLFEEALVFLALCVCVAFGCICIAKLAPIIYRMLFK